MRAWGARHLNGWRADLRSDVVAVTGPSRSGFPRPDQRAGETRDYGERFERLPGPTERRRAQAGPSQKRPLLRPKPLSSRPVNAAASSISHFGEWGPILVNQT